MRVYGPKTAVVRDIEYTPHTVATVLATHGASNFDTFLRPSHEELQISPET